jgi:tRNA modification GTPase
MPGYQTGDTIAASASAPAQQAIALVRLSGPRAWDIARACLADAPRCLTARQAYVCALSLAAAEARFTDTAVLTCWQAPASYTGEDMAELSVHGSPLLVQLLLDHCTQHGARLAEAGEFTYRAFINGKLDLAQAESVQELISASSERALVLAGNGLAGQASARAQAWDAALVRLLAQIEAFHDYAEDGLDASLDKHALPAADELKLALVQLAAELDGAIGASQRLLPWREGIAVAILGPPNAGKSTLFNALLGQARALTAPQAGTTRDYLAEPLSICGLRLSLVDTAGYHAATDSIEAAGIARSAAWGQAADVVLWVTAADQPAAAPPPFLSGAQMIQVRTRCDLLSAWPEPGPEPACCVSGLTGRGVAELREMLGAQAGAADEASLASFNRRQLGQLTLTRSALESALAALAQGLPLDTVAHDMYCARVALTGVYTQADRGQVIASIFSNFCVGK